MIVLGKENFETEVLENGEPILVDFWSESCEPCKALLPDIEQLEAEYESKLRFGKFDITKARRLAIKQKVLGLPTIAIYKDGEKVDEVTKDDATPANIRKMIEKHL